VDIIGSDEDDSERIIVAGGDNACSWQVFLSAMRGGLLFCLSVVVVVVRALPIGVFGVCAGIRTLPSCFTRRPCAGRHLLFFAAAKKSRQKKAANTTNISSCLRAPKGSYASHGSIPVRVRCQRFE
jgi:hypothetical protein